MRPYRNGSNQITASGYTYDAAGNQTSDGSHHYYYDPEGRIIQVDGTFGTCSSATICYVYDAKGMRIRQTLPSGSQEFIRDLQGDVVSDVLINYGFSRGYVYVGSEFLAQYGDGTTYFVQADHLGSTRLMTKPDQSIADSYDYVPFGEGLNGGGVTLHRFTGYERDVATGKDYARARYYAAPAASFLTPDPAGVSATCLLNPQTQNRYAYVTDNPVNQTDPSGLCGDGDNSDCGGIGITLPLFPSGGGDQPPALPAPHPVFALFAALAARSPAPAILTCHKAWGSSRGGFGCGYLCHGSGGISGQITYIRCGADRPKAGQPCPDEVITIDGVIDTDEFCGPAPGKKK